ncbi:MAG: hypothetical protein ACQEP7_03830 [bacterium]
MKNNNFCSGRIYRGIMLLLLAVLLSSCGYSDQLQLGYDLHHGPRWNSRRDRIVFIASSRAYRKPTGLARFPDGGIPEYLREDVSLYLFKPVDSTLKKLTSFNDLVELAGSYRSSWKTKIAFTEDKIYFNVRPVMDWDWHKDQAKSSEKIEQIKKLEKKYEKFYVCDPDKNKINTVDESTFKQKYSSQGESNKINLTELNKMLSAVSVAEWGLVLREIYPRTKQNYINSLVYAQNTSPLTRRAIIEQVVSKLPPEDIKNILEQMNSYKNKLNGYEREKYEKQTVEVREKLESLLASKVKSINN